MARQAMLHVFGRPTLDGTKQRESLRDIRVFSQCSDSELRAVDAVTCEVPVSSGLVLAREGCPCSQVIFVVEGIAESKREGDLIGMLSNGAHIGACEAMRRLAHTTTVTAATAMTVLALSVRDFRSLRYSIPHLEAACTGHDEPQRPRETATATASRATHDVLLGSFHGAARPRPHPVPREGLCLPSVE
jgi:signal-transduction protein with cAMP-binding, CBS, and nucleotidyltransferase domain